MGQLPVKLQFEGDDIYFAELSNHLIPGGLGLGTFLQDPGAMDNGTSLALNAAPSNTMIDEGSVGSLVRYVRLLAYSIDSNHLRRHSRWGLRIHCTKLPNARQNM
jgi:hypothetical protein